MELSTCWLACYDTLETPQPRQSHDPTHVHPPPLASSGLDSLRLARTYNLSENRPAYQLSANPDRRHRHGRCYSYTGTIRRLLLEGHLPRRYCSKNKKASQVPKLRPHYHNEHHHLSVLRLENTVLEAVPSRRADRLSDDETGINSQWLGLFESRQEQQGLRPSIPRSVRVVPLPARPVKCMLRIRVQV